MGILGDYLPSWLPDDPNQNAAARQGLLAAGAALMGGRGNLGGILAGGLMAGQQGYNGALQQQQQAGLAAAQQQRWDLENKASQAEMNRRQSIAGDLAARAQARSGLAAPSQPQQQDDQQDAYPLTSTPQSSVGLGVADSLSMVPKASIAPLRSLPQIGGPSATPTAQAVPMQQTTTQPAQGTDPFSDYYEARNTARFLASKYPDAPETAAALKALDALKPKVKEMKTVTLPGTKTRVLANFFDDPSIKPQILENVSPDAEKLVGYGAGGTYNFADPFSGTVVSSTNMTATPGEIMQSADQAKARAQSERHWQAEQAAAPDDAPMDPLAVRMTAQQYLAGDAGALQNFGRGRQGAANLNAVRLEVAKQANEAGLNGADIAAKMAEFQGLKAGQRTAGVRSASIEIAANEVAQLAPIALEASSKVSRSGYLPFGKAGVLFDSNTNDPAMRQFAMANTALVNAYGQAMARGGAATVSDKDHARELLSTAFDQPSYAAAVAQLQRETRAAQAAPKQVRQDLSDAVSGRDPHAPAAVTPLSNLPKKAPAVGAHPADITSLLNKYGTR